MNTESKIFAAPEDAYYEFFRADSAQQAEAWAAVMSYPHVRVSARGNPVYYETPEAYASGASWTQREATGWVRSVGIDPKRLHESANKVHLAGGWTRYNAQDEPILRNRVTYILTRVKGSWGIQARFGTDSFTEGERYDSTAAVDLVGQHLEALARGDFAMSARLCRYPFTEVGIGRVDRYRDAPDLEARLGTMAGNPKTTRKVGAVQEGSDGVVVASTWVDGNGDAVEAVFVVGRPDGRWRIAGRSAMRC